MQWLVTNTCTNYNMGLLLQIVNMAVSDCQVELAIAKEPLKCVIKVCGTGCS